MSTRTALIVAGVGVAVVVLYLAFQAQPTTPPNSDAIKAASPPPQPIVSTGATSLILRSPVNTGGGVLLGGGRNFFR